ncbi:hypothetical protein OG756_34070 [Streptomyces sp. NBC_01310]|uniref:hypothetical protein n=1 Tax=Streptomyces sp. NBC_01310 TaxID=2903820 RepID=UPI0035B5C69F|nr:hypothetical protein OG756_34070 [Streptomyces sp. NBC_01310]
MSAAPDARAVAALGTGQVAREVGMDPNVWAYNAMKDAPGHVQATVMAVMNTALNVNAVQRQLLDDAARAVEELSKVLTGQDTTDHRSTAGLLGDRSTRMEHLPIRRGELLGQLDTHLAIYQEAAAEPKPPATPAKALGLTHPVDTGPQARTPRR